MKNNELRRKIYDDVREELLRMGLISSSLKGHTVAINNIVDVVLKYGNSFKAELVKGIEGMKEYHMEKSNEGQMSRNLTCDEAIELVKKI